ncbi:MAG: molecular chaperone DnaJ [Patescibacteria group bacterium]|jgi:molecular chaperone DnaJ|nr:molecular chaperone DnaJ [Patescibacteria group bacterium]
MGKDYYKILGVEKGSSQDEIKKAFRKKAHEYHPDKKTGDEAKFKEINEAYQVLGDAKKKSQYDQFGSGFQNGQAGGAGGPGPGGFDGMNINMDDLGDMFGGFGDIFGFGGGGGRKRAQRGSDIETNVVIDFSEAVFGVEKEINIRKKTTCDKCKGEGAEPGSDVETCATCNGAGRVSRVQQTILGSIQTQTTCPACNGEGKEFSQKCTKCHGHGITLENIKLNIKIPAGIDNGESLRMPANGEAGEKGAPAGDLYIRVNVKEDKRFSREGIDIVSKKEISFTQAVLGDKIEVETVDGVVKLKIPEGTQSGTIFKMKGRGVNKLNGRGRGDHLVKVVILTPKNLDKKQRKILQDLNI